MEAALSDVNECVDVFFRDGQWPPSSNSQQRWSGMPAGSSGRASREGASAMGNGDSSPRCPLPPPPWLESRKSLKGVERDGSVGGCPNLPKRCEPALGRRAPDQPLPFPSIQAMTSKVLRADTWSGSSAS